MSYRLYKNTFLWDTKESWSGWSQWETYHIYARSAFWSISGTMGSTSVKLRAETNSRQPPLDSSWQQWCSNAWTNIPVNITRDSDCYDCGLQQDAPAGRCQYNPCLRGHYAGTEYIQLNFSLCNEQYIADKFYRNVALQDGKVSYTANTEYGPRHIYSLWGDYWGISETMGGTNINPRKISRSAVLPIPERTVTRHNDPQVFGSDWEVWCANSWQNNYMTLKPSNCYACPSNQIDAVYSKPYNMTTVGIGSTSVQQCLCPSQFVKVTDATCTSCAPGQELRNAACQNCLAGTYRDGISLTVSACTPCSAGTFNLQTGRVSACTQCPNGKYKTGTGPGECTDCSLGHYTDVMGAVSADACIKCAPGTQPRGDGASCQPCQVADATCTSCAPGQELRNAVCQNCLAGTYRDGISLTVSACTPCSAGTFNLQTGRVSACTQCPNGKYKTGIGPGECTDCSLGYYTNVMGAVSADSCIKCAPGTQPRSDGASCEPCPTSYRASDLTSAFTGTLKMPGCIEFVE